MVKILGKTFLFGCFAIAILMVGSVLGLVLIATSFIWIPIAGLWFIWFCNKDYKR